MNGKRKMVNSPNLFNEKAFRLGKDAFTNSDGLIVNPYDKGVEENDYMDWRIGWQVASMEHEIQERENNG
jgi:hypothetical protein